MKKLSIYIPTYNRKEHLQRQLEYIFSDIGDHLPETEVIVSDNASDDGTADVVKALREKHQFAYYRNERNLGVVVNNHLAGKYCTGEFLWLVSDDDWIKPGTVNKIFRILEDHPNLNFIHLNYALMHGAAIEYGFSFPRMPEEICVGYIKNPTGLVLDRFSEIGPYLSFSTVHILKLDVWKQAEAAIPADTLEGHGIDLIAPLAAIKKGNVYFDSDVSVYGNGVNISWKDIVLRALYGIQLSIKKLDTLGYSESEIRNIYRAFLGVNLANVEWLKKSVSVDKKNLDSYEKLAIEGAGYPLERFAHRETCIVFPYLKNYKGHRIVLYGAGRNGKELYRLCQEQGIEVVGWCDRNYEQLRSDGFPVDPPEIIQGLDYDYIVDTVADLSTFGEIFERLTGLGADPGCIKHASAEDRVVIDLDS